MEKFILVVYSYEDKDYKRVIGEPTENYNKLRKAMAGLDARLGDGYFSTIESSAKKKDKRCAT